MTQQAFFEHVVDALEAAGIPYMVRRTQWAPVDRRRLGRGVTAPPQHVFWRPARLGGPGPGGRARRRHSCFAFREAWFMYISSNRISTRARTGATGRCECLQKRTTAVTFCDRTH